MTSRAEQGFRIVPPDPPNGGILFVDHQASGRSGHNGQSLLAYKDKHILAFYINAVADQRSKGHHPLGWTEYRRSTDGGHTWGDPMVLEYSRQIYQHPEYFSAYVKQSVVAPDQTIVVLGCRFLKEYPAFDKAFYLKSYDEAHTWTEALDVGGDDPVYGRPQAALVHNGTIFVLFTHGAVWGEKHPHRLYVSTDNGQTFTRRSDLTLDVDCWYGTMTLLDDGSIIAYAYKNADEHHLQYVISHDDGYTWSSPQTAYMAKKIRNPQISQRVGNYFFMHGRSGSHGEERGNLVLYSSTDGIRWDEGLFLNKAPGTDSYSANEVIGTQDPSEAPRLLIQSSICYDGQRKVNVCHWWVEVSMTYPAPPLLYSAKTFNDDR